MASGSEAGVKLAERGAYSRGEKVGESSLRTQVMRFERLQQKVGAHWEEEVGVGR